MQRTKVYAAPAPIPPAKPISEGTSSIFEKVGRIMKRLPQKASITAATCAGEAFSFRIIIENTTAKNGDSLLSIEASARARWSTA